MVWGGRRVAGQYIAACPGRKYRIPPQAPWREAEGLFF
jgi:hypothetical protein